MGGVAMTSHNSIIKDKNIQYNTILKCIRDLIIGLLQLYYFHQFPKTTSTAQQARVSAKCFQLHRAPNRSILLPITLLMFTLISVNGLTNTRQPINGVISSSQVASANDILARYPGQDDYISKWWWAQNYTTCTVK